MTRPSVQPLREGRNAWKLGVLGFFTRTRGIAFTGGLTLLTMGSPWWLADISWLNYEVRIAVKYFIVGLILFVGTALVLGFYYLRKRSIRSLEIKYYLHQLAHDVRDRQTELHKTLGTTKSYSGSKLHKDLELLLREVAENIAAQFRLLTGDPTVCVAIRLARYEKSNKKIYYRTFARSKGLNAQRNKHSEDIPADEGIPRYLADHNDAQGVLIYNDLDEAAVNGTYRKTKNDEKFPDDIKTMMVAPLNAWSARKQSMLGLLYITSRKKNTFGPVHVDSIAFTADMTASAIANAFEIVKEKAKNQLPKNEGERYANVT